eukprot:3975263-Lingulodinium_polyedra.AAC.1
MHEKRAYMRNVGAQAVPTQHRAAPEQFPTAPWVSVPAASRAVWVVFGPCSGARARVRVP